MSLALMLSPKTSGWLPHQLDPVLQRAQDDRLSRGLFALRLGDVRLEVGQVLNATARLASELAAAQAVGAGGHRSGRKLFEAGPGAPSVDTRDNASVEQSSP